MRRLLIPVLLLCTLLLAVPQPVIAQDPVRLIINGREVLPDVPPVIVSDRTLVPVRFIAEALGFTVGWDGAAGKVTLTGRRVIQLTVGQAQATVDDAPVPLDVAPVNLNGRVMVPLRFVAEQMGASVNWDPQSRVVTVQGKTDDWSVSGLTPEDLLAWLDTLGAWAEGHTTGKLTASVQASLVKLDVTVTLDGYRAGGDLLVESAVEGPGISIQHGVAVREGRAWRLEADGTWAARAQAIPVPGAAWDLLRGRTLPELGALVPGVTVTEQGHEDGTYDVFDVQMDVNAVRALVPALPESVQHASLFIRVRVSQETGLPEGAVVNLTAEDRSGVVIHVDGNLAVAPLEGPIPFPPEVLAE